MQIQYGKIVFSYTFFELFEKYCQVNKDFQNSYIALLFYMPIGHLMGLDKMFTLNEKLKSFSLVMSSWAMKGL